MTVLGLMRITVFAIAISLIWHASLGQEVNTATCTVQANSGVAAVEGTILFSQPTAGGAVTINVQLSGFTPGGTNHGFHVHESGDLGNNCTNCGPHYNPRSVAHGGPQDNIRHVGDLGNVAADSDGTVNTTITDSVISLIGDYSVIGKSIVVHQLEDDLGRGNFSDSNTTGHAGLRFGCCLISSSSSDAAISSLNPIVFLLWLAIVFISTA